MKSGHSVTLLDVLDSAAHMILNQVRRERAREGPSRERARASPNRPDDPSFGHYVVWDHIVIALSRAMSGVGSSWTHYMSSGCIQPSCTNEGHELKSIVEALPILAKRELEAARTAFLDHDKRDARSRRRLERIRLVGREGPRHALRRVPGSSKSASVMAAASTRRRWTRA